MDVSTAYGVDFSAAAESAGRNTWIASGTVADGALSVDRVRRATDTLDVGAAREATLPALADWITGRGADAVVGLDFPLGLPAFVVDATGAGSWPAFVDGFPENLVAAGGVEAGNDPVDAFADACRRLTPDGRGTFAKRATDGRHGAQSPYNFIVDTITFHGIAEVVRRLRGDARFEPMGAGKPAGPTVVETYPAGTLDRLGLDRDGYKGGSAAETERRRRNLAGLRDVPSVVVADAVVETAVDDGGGDAHDAVVACVAAFRAARTGFEVDADVSAAAETEGWIYV